MVIAHKNHVSRGVLLFKFRVRQGAAVIAEGLTEIADVLQAAVRIGSADLAFHLQQSKLLRRCPPPCTN